MRHPWMPDTRAMHAARMQVQNNIATEVVLMYENNKLDGLKDVLNDKMRQILKQNGRMQVYEIFQVWGVQDVNWGVSSSAGGL